MKEKLKKVFVLFFITGVTVVSAFSTSASTSLPKATFKDACLKFEVWKGNGTSSVSIGDDFLTKNMDIVKFEEFEELQFDGKIFDNSNFTVTKVKENTVITLKEEYLKTLKDGTYLFDAVFSRAKVPLRLQVVTRKVSLTDAYFAFSLWTGNGSAQVNLGPNTFSYGFYPELFNDLLYKGNKVDRSNYSISEFANVTKIILKEEYIKKLPDGEHYFTADFMNVNIKLKLKIEKVKKLSQVKKVKVTSKKKRLTIRWKKQKNVTGYRIRVGTNKKITKNLKVVTLKKNKNKVTIKGLKSSKKYYVKVRAYKTINGKTYWGLWSKKIHKKAK